MDDDTYRRVAALTSRAQGNLVALDEANASHEDVIRGYMDLFQEWDQLSCLTNAIAAPIGPIEGMDRKGLTSDMVREEYMRLLDGLYTVRLAYSGGLLKMEGAGPEAGGEAMEVLADISREVARELRLSGRNLSDYSQSVTLGEGIYSIAFEVEPRSPNLSGDESDYSQPVSRGEGNVLDRARGETQVLKSLPGKRLKPVHSVRADKKRRRLVHRAPSPGSGFLPHRVSRDITSSWVVGPPFLTPGILGELLNEKTYILGYRASHVTFSDQVPPGVTQEWVTETSASVDRLMKVAMGATLGLNIPITGSIAASLGLSYEKVNQLQTRQEERHRISTTLVARGEWRILYTTHLHATMAVLHTNGKGAFDASRVSETLKNIKEYIADLMHDARGDEDVTRGAREQQKHIDALTKTKRWLLWSGVSDLYYVNVRYYIGYSKDPERDFHCYDNDNVMSTILS